MLNIMTELGQLLSLGILAYGALLCLGQSGPFQEMTGSRRQRADDSGRLRLDSAGRR